eukprot:4543678-Pyramimonas_sp.AAC.1
MHWQDWSPTGGNVPKAMLNTRPFEVALDPVEFPAVQDGSGGGAIHSYYPGAVVDFLKRGNADADFFPVARRSLLLAAWSALLSVNAPKGETPSIVN